MLPDFQWVPQNTTWSRWKPVIRCALAAWICGLLFIISKTENAMGQASFLILVASFISPPNDPFMAVLERELLIMLFVAATWAWACLGIKLADLARTQHVPNASLAAIITAQYIEAAPAIILGIFVFIGSAVLLYIKARMGPGPFLFASIFGCICLDITLTTAGLFPYPYYMIGKVIAIPLAMHSTVALVVSALAFPSSISAQFTDRLQASVAPLITGLELHRNLLRTPTDSPDFSTKGIIAAVNQADGSLANLAAAARLLKIDIIYSRFGPSDFEELHKLMRRLVVRSNGMTVYFTLLDPTRERFPMTPAPSGPQTPVTTTPSTHPRLRYGKSDPQARSHSHHRHSAPCSESRSQKHDNLLHNSLLHLAISRNPKPEHAVGVFESNRYLNLESMHLSHPDSVQTTARITKLLDESADELIGGCAEALKGVHTWMGQVREGRWDFWSSKMEKTRDLDTKIKKYEEMKNKLEDTLQRFRYEKRHKVLDPYRPAFDPNHVASMSDEEMIPHRYLFDCYVYQYHLLQFAIIVVNMLAEIVRLEKLRKEASLWTPAQPIRKLLFWSRWEASEHMEKFDDEDPDVIQGVEPEWLDDLGTPKRRDPDALPPRNVFESMMNHIYKTAVAMRGGNTLFAIKAAVLTVLLCIPSFLKSSGSFAYSHKFVWAVFMGQLTISRFRGDTAFGFVARIISTFFGGLAGLVMWYISAGNGHGNPYGLAAVFAVCFPFFFFARLYWPGPPMTNLIFFVTAALVVGYSYQDTHLLIPASPGWGFSVFWRRFVLVTIGVFGAFIFSFLPPSTTIRYHQRACLATSSTELGAIYCSIVSYANDPNRNDDDTQRIMLSLLAIRSKLKRSIVLRTNVIYEFSFRGKWPIERYHKLLEIQVDAGFLLSHLMSVVERLEPAWARAFLRRTRLLDANFQGDVLAVITMVSNSLRSGQPLPQITPCPLLDRFMARHHGLNVIHQESDDDFGLPRTLTMDTLQNEQYLIFSVGVATTFAIITRLDRLMIAAKDLVGEQYHIHGVGLWMGKNSGIGIGSRTSTMRLPQEV
ncbi:hypothetical protein PILCRDRAFT_62336 [Piloderma croceum F 1598]|uniref:ER transporter 6TM N-terminal domain-containing protein n=1 Tax=Piloderma croceum (strain F 1598) TaxID=765440 RepID=A0A0C3CFK9_PILCF|nr:hypothetical protein PILCRDRAFT_62336 [Piloderma croceum F 1598]